MSENKTKKVNWPKIVFWITLIVQIIIFIAVLKSGEVYEQAYKFAHVFLIVFLITVHQLVKSSEYWEKMYMELLDINTQDVTEPGQEDKQDVEEDNKND